MRDEVGRGDKDTKGVYRTSMKKHEKETVQGELCFPCALSKIVIVWNDRGKVEARTWREGGGVEGGGRNEIQI